MFRVTTLMMFLTVFILVYCQALAAKSTSKHSREKRRYGAVFRGALTGAAWGSYAGSIGFTIYHAVTRCSAFRPKPCNPPVCEYLKPCPGVCVGPDNNRKLSLELRDKTQKTLDKMDSMLLDAFNLEVAGKSAFLNNRRIVDTVTKINGHFDQMTLSIGKLDIGISEKFSNKSVEIQALLNDRRLTLRDIIISPAIQGIFDKWTWGGTGRFALSIGFTVGFPIFSSLKQRYVVHKLYKEMKLDFSRRFLNQKPSIHNLNNPKLRNNFGYVQGYSTEMINSQILKTTKAVNRANQATKMNQIVTKYVTPAINLIYTAFSVWDAFTQWNNCQILTNKMYDTSKNLTGEREKVEKIMETDVKPLRQQVIKEVWKPVLDFLTNNTIHDMLADIRNLTLEVNNKSISANTIEYFLQHIAQDAIPKTVFRLQDELIPALEQIEFRLGCVAGKQHAVVVAISECRAGWIDFNEIFASVSSTLKLNKKDCIENKMVPFTSQRELELIVDDVAQHNGWQSNCLLNNHDLLLRVCKEKDNGYSTIEIIKQIKTKILTEDMVNYFLSKCPIQNQDYICKLYCLNETPQQIANNVGFTESQVNEVIKKCYYSCHVSAAMETEICALHYCKGEIVSSIEKKVRFPWEMVNFVINKRCQNCVLNEKEKKEVCNQMKCKAFIVENIALQLGLPLETIKEITLNDCEVILPSCGPVSNFDQKLILLYHCLPQPYASAEKIFSQSLVDGVSLQRIQSVINSADCPVFLAKLYIG